MSKFVCTRPRGSKMLAWLIVPLLLLAVLAGGGFSRSWINAAHASSPVNGRYIFHATALAGPQAGFSIHGSLALTSLQRGGVGRVGTLCRSTPDSRGCALVTGTISNNVNVTFMIHATTDFPAISLTGTFEPTSGELCGTFVFGYGAHQSSGNWDARVTSHIPTVAGTWHLSGHVTMGPNTGLMFFRGTLDLVQTSSNMLIGMYCPERHGAGCVRVTGENRNSYVFIYVGDPTAFKLRGTFRSKNQLIGTVEVFKSVDRGIWSATRIA